MADSDKKAGPEAKDGAKVEKNATGSRPAADEKSEAGTTKNKKVEGRKSKNQKQQKPVRIQQSERDRELKELESRFRKHRKSQRDQITGVEDEGKRRKAFLKVAILAFLMAIALALALYPRFKKQKREDKIPLPAPEKIVPFGDEAMLPKGCREVRDATLAQLASLPKGSRTAQQLQKDFADEQKLPIEVENSIGMRFRLVPAPQMFTIGSPTAEEGRGPDEVQHTAVLKANLYVGKYEVTQEQFQKVMNFNPAHFKNPKLPVEEVTWFHAMKFCENLSKLEDVAVGSYTLPTEEQWEYACRAFSSTRFHCGDEDKNLYKFAAYSQIRTETPGMRRSNAFGLYNMHGNVWEWCKNFIHDYKTKEPLVFSNPHIKEFYKRGIRGGNFVVDEMGCRSATRNCLPDTSHGNMLGFRVIRVILKSQLARAGSKTENGSSVAPPVPTKGQLPDEDGQPEDKAGEGAPPKTP